MLFKFLRPDCCCNAVLYFSYVQTRSLTIREKNNSSARCMLFCCGMSGLTMSAWLSFLTTCIIRPPTCVTRVAPRQPKVTTCHIKTNTYTYCGPKMYFMRKNVASTNIFQQKVNFGDRLDYSIFSALFKYFDKYLILKMLYCTHT